MGDRPNILFMLSDDQGAWAMHCAGTPELHTPNLDRIAGQGLKFDDFYCVSPVCSPARASLLTGTIPSAHGVHDWIRSGNVDGKRFERQGRDNPYANGYADERKPISYLEGQLTYTDVLKQNGYTCALAGKWHLGDSVTPQHGFSRWFTLGKGGCNYYHPDIVEDGDITVCHGKYVTELFADKAIEYLGELGQKEEPFYLSVHFTAPHSPWGADNHPAKWIEYYENCDFASIPDVPDHPDLVTGPVYGTVKRKENLRGYFAAISAMDEQVGRILDALEEKDLADDTIVIFTADNGMSMGQHGVWGKGNGTFPMNMYESSVKVPFLISYPKLIPAGVASARMVSAYDVFPTLVQMAGLEMPPAAGLPGQSFLPCLMGEESRQEDDEIVVFDEYGPVRMIRDREWKYVHRYPYGKHELYHLSEDPMEENNLYGKSEYEEQTVMMRTRMERWFNRYANPDTDGTREGVTGCGQMCRAGVHGNRAETYAPLGT